MTSDELRWYLKDRWLEIRRLEVEELRRRPAEAKLRIAARRMVWPDSRHKERSDGIVSARWSALRTAYVERANTP